MEGGGPELKKNQKRGWEGEGGSRIIYNNIFIYITNNKKTTTKSQEAHITPLMSPYGIAYQIEDMSMSQYFFHFLSHVKRL